MAEAERLQKILARVGVCSRRQAEDLIAEGLVTVNGKIATKGQKATWGKDSIKVRGKLLVRAEAPLYYAFHKPKKVIGMIGTDPENRPTISTYMGELKVKLFPIGRMEFMNEGLVLLTNDGDLADAILKNPDIPRVFTVKVGSHVSPEILSKLRRGATVDRKKYVPRGVRIVRTLNKNTILEFLFVGMGPIELRPILERQGLRIERITLSSIGQIQLKDLPAGTIRRLEKSQLEAVLRQPDLGIREWDKRDTDKKKKED